jgi:hypothetical protein
MSAPPCGSADHVCERVEQRQVRPADRLVADGEKEVPLLRY